jgi:hypothetical protein
MKAGGDLVAQHPASPDTELRFDSKSSAFVCTGR